jgi:hypothetical protein
MKDEARIQEPLLWLLCLDFIFHAFYFILSKVVARLGNAPSSAA